MAVHKATCSVSVADKATMGFLLLTNLITPPDMTNRFPVEICQLSNMSPPQSASENPISLQSVDFSYVSPRLIVPLR